MVTRNKLASRQIHRAPISRRMLQGAAIGLIMISALLYSVNNPDPSWSKYWMVRPLIVVPIAGAMAGVWYFIMDHFRSRGGWKTVLANVASLIGLLFALWIGTILGCVGTLWH